jgi:hypothetical protein
MRHRYRDGAVYQEYVPPGDRTDATGTLGFEQTLVRIEVFRGKAGIEGFSIVAKKGDKVLHDVVEVFIAPRNRRAMRHLRKSQDLSHLSMPLQPVTLGSEAKDVALVHDDEEHDQSLMLINKGMSPVGTG